MSRFETALRASLGLALSLTALACDPVPTRPHVILISVDTLRADALETYGYDRATSPAITRFADGAFVFRRAFTHSPNTIVSHASMLTGLYPRAHGAHVEHPLDATLATLAELLGAAGYRTGGFATHGDWLTVERGFAQGFDAFESAYRGAGDNNEAALGWIDGVGTRLARARGRPLFLFLHYYDVHSDWGELPYEGDARLAAPTVGGFRGCRAGDCSSRLLERANREPALLDAREVAWIRSLYDGGVADLDRNLGTLFAALDRRGLFDSSWIIVTSDHGEEFREHGRLLHSQPYRETAHVPLIVRPPGGIPRRDVDTLAGIADVVPTVLDVVGAPLRGTFDGRSLAGVMRGETMEARLLPFRFDHHPAHVSLRDGRHHAIVRAPEGRVELYDTAIDPAESLDISAEQPVIGARMIERARRFAREPGDATDDAPGFGEIDEAAAARLRALGYGD